MTKFTVAVDEDGEHHVRAIVRNKRTGRDYSSTVVEAGQTYSGEVTEDEDLVIGLGDRNDNVTRHGVLNPEKGAVEPTKGEGEGSAT